MKLIFTFDDALKSQLDFHKETGLPATYFTIPQYVEENTTGSRRRERMCVWSEVAELAKHGEIGFHGHSADSYNNWTDEKTNQTMQEGADLFEKNIGYKPASFAYTNMNPGRIDLISKFCPYIRDYYLRELKPGWALHFSEQAFRVEKSFIPADFLMYRPEIFVIHAFEKYDVMKERTEIIAKEFKYLVLIAHAMSKKGMETWGALAKDYEVITFKEIFE